MAQSIFDYIYGEDRFKPSNDGVLAQLDELNRRSDPNPPTQAPTQVTPMPKSLYENMRRVANDEVDLPDTANILRNVSEYGVMGGDLIDFVAENPSLSAELGGELVSGLVQQAVPEEFEWNSEAEDMVDSIVDAIADDYMKNYGSLDGFAEYVRETPVDAFADLSGAGVLAKVGKEALVKAAKNPNLQEQVFQALETMMDKTGGRSYAVGKEKGVSPLNPNYGQPPMGGTPRKGRGKKDRSDAQRIEESSSETDFDRTETPDKVSIFDLEGEGLLTSISDKTQGGRLLTKINEQTLKNPVNMRGGMNYMMDKENIKLGNLWANDQSGVNKHMNKFDDLRRQTGKDPIFAPFTMQPTGGDFSHQTTETMFAYADTVLSQADKKELNKKLKEAIPEWKGFNSPETPKVINNLNERQRNKARQIMDRDFRNKGGLSVGESRIVNTDPDLMNKEAMRFHNFGRMSGGQGYGNHPSYPRSIKGEPIGQIKEDFPVSLLFDDQDVFSYDRYINNKAYDQTLFDRKDPTSADYRSFTMSPKSTVITDEKLKDVEKYLKGLLD